MLQKFDFKYIILYIVCISIVLVCFLTTTCLQNISVMVRDYAYYGWIKHE